MEFIKKGIDPGPKTWKGTCNNCGSVVRALEKELRITNDPRDYTQCGSARCPLCNNYINFYEESK